MTRIAGFLVGSAMAITAMLIVLGIPRFQSSEPESIPQLEPEQKPKQEQEQEPKQEQELELELESESELEPIALKSLPEPDVLQVDTPPEVAQPIVALAEPFTMESQWHSFWSPFGSQIAANGFVSRLEAVTGYDYRVVKIRTGVYEVTFAYSDEEERLSKLSVIASATGLELPDS